MTRDATAGVLTAVGEYVLRLIILVELDYATGFVRVNSSDRLVSFDFGAGSVDFLGIGQLGSISSVGETKDLQASRLALTLSGLPPAALSYGFESAQGRAGKIWAGYLNSSYNLISDPTVLFTGLIDNTDIAMGAEGSITVYINNRLIEWQREKIRRYTNEDQQAEYPGDRFFEYVNQAVEREIVWGPGGAEAVNSTPGRLGGGGQAGRDEREGGAPSLLPNETAGGKLPSAPPSNLSGGSGGKLPGR